MKIEIPVSNVLSSFLDMTGETEACDWIEFCKASCNTIAASVRENIDVSAYESQLCYTAACHAFYMYVLRGCAGNIASFKALDITIENVNQLTLNAAKAIFEGAMASISHLLKSTRFAFKAV